MDRRPMTQPIMLPDSIVEFDPLNGGDIEHDGESYAFVEECESADNDSWGVISWSIYRRASDGQLFALPWRTSCSEIGEDLAAMEQARIGSGPWGPALHPVVLTGTRQVSVYDALDN